MKKVVLPVKPCRLVSGTAEMQVLSNDTPEWDKYLSEHGT